MSLAQISKRVIQSKETDELHGTGHSSFPVSINTHLTKPSVKSDSNPTEENLMSLNSFILSNKHVLCNSPLK